ncbi:MAG: PEP-CTERM sorting domain-containing protein [Gammaproteobacteria bacterium]|nr:PEP-CTERM sorting domain-containing protein [Gammaproteobacteria bacterium]
MSTRASLLVAGLWILTISSTWPQRLDAELVGFWNFDGNVEDLSAFENHGQLVDAQYSDNVPGVIGSGQSIDFTENTDHVLIEADESLDSQSFTLSMFTFDRGQTGALERLTSREGDSFETAINVHGPFNGMGEYAYYASAGGGWQWNDKIPPLDKWQHVAYVATEDETMLIYVDGELTWESDPWNASPAGFMHIGNRWNNVEGFDGLIDNVALWNEVLDAASIRDLAAGGCIICLSDGTTPGDFNGDGTVDSADFGIMAENFNTQVSRGVAHSLGDFDLNTRVDLNDFLGFRKLFNSQGAVAAVPEPTGMYLSMFGILGLIGFRRRR